jgi:hypothetical protein
MGCGRISKPKDMGSPRTTGEEEDEVASKDHEREDKRRKSEANIVKAEAERRSRNVERISKVARESTGEVRVDINEDGTTSSKPPSSGEKSHAFSERATSESVSSRAGESSNTIATVLSRMWKDKRQAPNRSSELTTSTSKTSVLASQVSCKSIKSYNSQAHFADPDQTIIIFDWDDTLCPSSWLRKYQFDQRGNMKAGVDSQSRKKLAALADEVNQLLDLAQSIGEVILVTNAKTPWVAASCQTFLPSCQAKLQNTQVFYALEIMQKMENDKRDFDTVLTDAKAQAMKAAVTDFYSRYPNQSWKNIISIGDAFFEHDAIRQVSRERPQKDDAAKKCRTKTVKLLDGPTISGMIMQLSLVRSWLMKIVEMDEDVNINLAADEETINAWMNQFG